MNPDDYCILVAEDQPVLRYLTVRTLSEHGYCVMEAMDGQHALRLEAEYDGTIHVLVTNVHMPGCDGHELARRLKVKRPDIKVLIVSSDHERDFPPQARSHDFALMKPVDSKSLLTHVAQLLRERGDRPPSWDA